MQVSERLRKVFLALSVVLLFGLLYRDLFSGDRIFVNDSIIWYGSFHYFVDSLSKGIIPYWNPYVITGMPNYQLIPGMLDPTMLIAAGAARLSTISLLDIYVYFRLTRLFLFAAGAFFLFRHITRCFASSLTAAAVLLFAVTPSYCKQAAAVDVLFLYPAALHSLVLFLENRDNPRKSSLALAVFVLATGISVNTYIPAYFLFNIVCFFIGLIFIRIVSPSALLRSDKKLLFKQLLAASLAVVLLSLPSMSVLLRDISGDGELFPMQRIYAQDGVLGFKKLLATEVDSSRITDSLISDRGSFLSYGSVANLLYPDILRSFRFFVENNYVTDIDLYIGIIPLVLAITGLSIGRSRYGYVAAVLACITFANMFGFSDFGDRPYNLVQRFFNSVFPLLKMTRVRQMLGIYFLFYLCLLAAIGMKTLFSGDAIRDMTRGKMRMISGICIVMICIKFAVTFFWGGRLFFTSMSDFLVVAQLALFPVLVLAAARSLIKPGVSRLALITVILADLFLFNSMFVQRDFNHRVLQDRSPIFDFVDNASASKEFEYFRVPFSGFPFLAFQENVEGIKGAFSRGMNHTLFTTRRYYDFLTHVPLETQFSLNGILRPVLQFFPAGSVVEVPDGKTILAVYSSAGTDVLGNLFIEKSFSKPDRPAGLGDLARYESLPWLQPELVMNYYNLMTQSQDYMRDIQAGAVQYLHTPLYSVDVEAFSPNELVATVRNAVDGYLYYNDGWSKYWEAYEGPDRLPVKPANYNFKAVFLGRGEHRVRFVYNPVHFKLSLAGFATGLFLSAGAIIFFSRKGMAS